MEGEKHSTIWIKFNENNNTILMKLGVAYHEIEFLINLRRFSWILHLNCDTLSQVFDFAKDFAETQGVALNLRIQTFACT